MGDLKARIARLIRRHSAVPTLGSGDSKHSLGRGGDGGGDKAASTRTNTHTHIHSHADGTQAAHSPGSTTGYAASLSTAGGDENSDRSTDVKKSMRRDSRLKISTVSSTSSTSRSRSRSRSSNSSAGDARGINGGINGDIHGPSQRRAETVPQEEEEEHEHEHKHKHKHKLHEGELEPELVANSNKPSNPSNKSNNKHNSNVVDKPDNAAGARASTTATSGNDLQNSALTELNLTTAPSPAIITTSAAPRSSNPEPQLPLPSIHEYPPTNSTPTDSTATTAAHFQINLDHHHHHHHNHDGAGDTTATTTTHLQPPLHTPSITAPTPFSLSPVPTPSRPTAPRRQSIIPNRQTTLIKTLLNTGYANSEVGLGELDQLLPISGNMVTRKIWVKRPLASSTLITINEDDLVDDVRELILRKYANSLGRQFDAPDLTLRICNREQQTSRILQPDEPMGRTLDAYYPGGQSVDDALIIDIPSRRTPKASPNPRYYGDERPHESGTDYFPPYPPTTHAVASTAPNGGHTIHFPPAMAILGGSQLPPLPSPGGTRRLGASSRPKIQRMHTASPGSSNGPSQSGAPSTGTLNYPRQQRSRTHSGASSEQSAHPPPAPPIPTPPGPERTATPPPRVSSPRLSNRAKKNKKPIEHPALPPGMLNGAVPPINVLIVEDNIINLKLLEAFVKRLKVRWQTAMNGREAVNKWRAGGFHLVLMDIQLPVMSGLDATREIRRIEKVNSIGVFSSSASSPPEEVKAEPAEEDKLVNTEMFKSPVIIVALTASSLQSDRHEALAAGCNDFLTKPVNFVWLERKVMEWGCMQALIDFDGWRKWKDFSQKTDEDEASKKAATNKAKPVRKNRLSMTAAA